jgi:hypothetical protein
MNGQTWGLGCPELISILNICYFKPEKILFDHLIGIQLTNRRIIIHKLCRVLSNLAKCLTFWTIRSHTKIWSLYYIVKNIFVMIEGYYFSPKYN